MKLRHRFPPTLIRRAVLVTGFILLGQATGWTQSLTASAAPASGAAGVNSSYLTGSGFPAGSITNAVVHLGTSCAAPALASASAKVTTQASLRRFQFLIPASLAPGTYKAWVSGKVGTNTFSTLSRSSCSNLTVTASVLGTASLGAAIAGANVTLVDAVGNSRSGTTASDGTFGFSSAGLVPPFLIKAVTTTASGGFPAGTTLYSVSADANASTRVNVHVLTDLMVRSYYSAQDINPDSAFLNPVGANAAPTPAAVLSLANLVIPALRLWLDNAGLTATSGPPAPGEINLISSPLIAYQPGMTPPGGLDAVLHQIVSETVDPSDGSISGVVITGGTVTETITPVYSDGLITLNATTIDSATGTGSSGSFAGLALTPTLQPILDGITATLNAFRNTVNTKGAALTAADVLPFYSPNYLNAGVTAAEEAAEIVDELAGATITALEPIGITSLSNGVAQIILFIAAEAGSENFSDVDALILRNEGGTWLLFGDQRVADVGVTAQSRRAQGAASLGPGVTSGTFVFAGTSARQGVVTTSVVAGPTNNATAKIWASNATSQALFKGPVQLENGEPFDQFVLLSQPLGNDLATISSLVPVGSTFTFTLNTTTHGMVQYTDQSNSFTTEVIEFSGISTNAGAGPLSSVVGQTLTYNFSLPQTYPIGSVFLFAQIFDGPFNNPATRGCGISSGHSLTLNFAAHNGSGQFSFPSDMSPCGLPGVPIAIVNVFFEVEGVNGEVNLVQLNYPY